MSALRSSVVAGVPAGSVVVVVVVDVEVVVATAVVVVVVLVVVVDAVAAGLGSAEESADASSLVRWNKSGSVVGVDGSARAGAVATPASLALAHPAQATRATVRASAGRSTPPV